MKNEIKAIVLIIISLLTACSSTKIPQSNSLNSRYQEEQPALSGDGRWLAFVTNRDGKNQIVLYNLQQNKFVELPNLNSSDAIAENPSLSRTGRYLVYLSTVQNTPQIFLYDRATNRSEILTKNYRHWLRNPHISPDGRYIVFETSRRGQWDLEVLDRGFNIELDIPDGSIISDQ
jgi:Tol biopolymer transport system component